MSSENSKPDQQQVETLSRREALGKGVKLAAGITGAALASKLGIGRAMATEAPTSEEPANAGHEGGEGHEGEQKSASMLDLGTASLVAGNFARHVIINGAIRGKDLGSRSAIEMNSLAGLRIAALKAFGTEKEQHLADHEIHEIKGGLLPVPVLVALSDATTTELQVDSPLIFESVQGSLEPTMEYANIKRPDFSADIKEWESHLEKANADIVKKTAQIAAITSVLAPLGTTYTSSSLANDLKEGILRMLYEQSLAIEVIDRKQKASGESRDHLFVFEAGKDGARQAAYKRADDLFNGTWGYSKLMLTLSANTQGSWGLGDPPEVYFLMDYIDDPKTLAKAHAMGAINSEAYTMLLNTIWLKKTGAFSSAALGEFLSSQKIAIEAIAKSIANKDLRSTSFNGSAKHVQGVIDALGDENDPSGKLRQFLSSVPQARLKFSLKAYLAKKQSILSGQEKRMAAIDPADISSLDDFAGSKSFSDLFAAFNSGNTTEAKKMLGALETKIQGKQGQDLAILFEGLLKEAANDTSEMETPVSDDVKSPETDQPNHTARIMDEISGVLEDMDDNTRQGRIENALNVLGVPAPEQQTSKEEYGKQVYAALSHADEKTIATAISEFHSIEGHKDAVPGMEETSILGEEVSAARAHATEHRHEVHFLSHSAKEVLWALLTQIPSVPAIARLADVSIPAISGVKSGETPTPAQLKKIVATLLPIEAGMSGIADNVAAYMFARSVLMGFFERTFGNDVWEQFSDLKGNIGIIAKMIAEQAGSLTKVGNGPNFSQEKCTLLRDDSNNQGISIDRTSVSMGETLPHKNAFASIANGSLVAMATGYLWGQIDQIAAARAKTTPEEVKHGRRDAIRKLFGRA